MDWSNEDYVRLYTRETDDDLVLSWQARAVWHEMLKRFDRSGLIAMRRGRMGLAALLRLPIEIVDGAIPELLTDGRIRELDIGYFAPNFMEAQEATKSDKQRQKESRERRHARSMGGDSQVTKRDSYVTNRDHNPSSVTERDADVTNRDRSSRGGGGSVTLTSADPDPNLREPPARAHAIPPTAPPTPTEPPKITIPPKPAISTAPPEDPRALGRIAIELWRGVSADRLAVAAELGLAHVLPLPECDSPREPGAFRELRDRLREEGAHAEAVARHVRAALLERARADRSIEWLAEKAFTEGGWRTARSYVLGAAKRPKAGAPATEMRVIRRDDEPPPFMPAAGGSKP